MIFKLDKDRFEKYMNLFVTYKVIIFVAIAFIVASLNVENFFSPVNLGNILSQMSINGIVAIGITLIMIPWGIDLAVGSEMALTGVVFVVVSNLTGSIPIGIIAALSIGVVVGIFNGVCVTRFKIHFFVVTLASMSVVRGIAIGIAGENTVYAKIEGFQDLGNSFIFLGPLRIESPVFFFFGLAVFAHIILKYTQLGRMWYSIGSNPEASYLSGINVKKVFTLAFIAVSLCAALAGILLASKTNSCNPLVGQDTNMIAIAAAVLGGTGLYGGRGSIPGTVMGVIFMSVMNNILNMSAISPYYQYIVRGSILVMVILIDAFYEQLKHSGFTIMPPEEELVNQL